MAATLNVPVIGIERVDGYNIKFQRRDGATAVWMTLLGSIEIENVDLGTVIDLHTNEPRERIFQRCAHWATADRRAQIRAFAVTLYREDEAARRAGA